MTGRTAAYGRAAFAWAVKRGVSAAPIRLQHLPVVKGAAKRERVLSDAGDRRDLAGRRRGVGALTAPIIRLLILTGQRRGEVAGMAWDELTEDLATWTLPGQRTKNGAAHTVPLSAPARELFRELSCRTKRAGGTALCFQVL